MPTQTAANVLAALAREADIDTPAPSGAGAERIRMVDSPGLKMMRSQIASEERRPDRLQHIGRLGGKEISGSFETEVNPGGAFDLLLESLARGTWGALGTNASVSAGTQVQEVATPADPIYTSYSIEQYDEDIDASELFTGCRVTGAQFSLQPNNMSRATWNFMGRDRQIIAPASAPHFTNPASPDGIPLIADDSSIDYAGSAVTTITGIDIDVSINAAIQPVIGTFITPDVYMNMLTVSGTISAVRESLDELTAFDAETEFAIRVNMSAPGADPKLTFGIYMPRVKIGEIDAPFLGGDAAKVESRSFTAHPTQGASDAIYFYTSTGSPIAVV